MLILLTIGLIFGCLEFTSEVLSFPKVIFRLARGFDWAAKISAGETVNVKRKANAENFKILKFPIIPPGPVFSNYIRTSASSFSIHDLFDPYLVKSKK
jgi:hypothetical protein